MPELDPDEEPVSPLLVVVLVVGEGVVLPSGDKPDSRLEEEKHHHTRNLRLR